MRTHIVANDVHYYLKEDVDYILESPLNDYFGCSNLYVSGMKYSILPGSYDYLYNQGTFKITGGDSEYMTVRSLPQGASTPYCHPVTSHRITHEYDFNDYSWFSFVGTLLTFGLKNVRNPLKGSFAVNNTD
jgi:hypothetical protein